MEVVLTQVVIAGVGSVLCFIFVGLAIKTLTADKSSYRQNQIESGSLIDALKGTSLSKRSSSSCRIREGLAINTKTLEIVPQGALSDDAINSILK